MRDHLDDCTPPPGDHAAVVARARRLLLRRRGLLAGAGTATVAAVVTLVVALQGGSAPAARLALAEPTTTTASETPSEGASPSASATPGPTASAPKTHAPPRPTATASPPAASPSASPTPTCYDNRSDDCPDGRSGYGQTDSFSGCGNTKHVADGESSADLGAGAVAELHLPDSVAGGSDAAGSLVITNHGTAPVEVTVDPDHGYHSQGIETPSSWDARTVGGAVHWHSQQEFGPEPESFSLQPAEAKSFTVSLTTAECGDTQSDKDVPLAAGDYRVGFDVRYGIGETADQTTALGGTLHIT